MDFERLSELGLTRHQNVHGHAERTVTAGPMSRVSTRAVRLAVLLMVLLIHRIPLPLRMLADTACRHM